MSQRDEEHIPRDAKEKREKSACTVHSLSEWRAKRPTRERGAGALRRARGKDPGRGGSGRKPDAYAGGYRGTPGYGYGGWGSYGGYGGYRGSGGYGRYGNYGGYGAFGESGSRWNASPADGGKQNRDSGQARDKGRGRHESAVGAGGRGPGRGGAAHRTSGPGGAVGPGAAEAARRRGRASVAAWRGPAPAGRFPRTVLWLAALALVVWLLMWLRGLSEPAAKPLIEPAPTLRTRADLDANPRTTAGPSSTLFHVYEPPLRPQ